jgi:predicted transcriptional regulator
MPLNLSDIIKKAENKGIKYPQNSLLRPWQQESILFAKTIKKQTEINHKDSLWETQDKLETNLGQTQDKLETNSGQTQDKPRTELRTNSRTNLGQTQDKLRTNLGQTQDKPRTNLGQTTIKESFLSLTGLQKEITLYLYENCKLSRDKITSQLTINNIATSCNTSEKSIHKSIQRLEKKGVIIRNKFKCGRGGWTKYEVVDYIFQEILHYETQDKLRTNLGQTWDKPETNLGQTQDKLGTELRTELRTNASSSSIYNINTTTMDSDDKNQMLDEWLEVDITPLEEFGFTKTHLKQIANQNKLSPEIVQNSIYAYAFDLYENKKGEKIKDKISYFMGILRKGLPYTPPDNYESEQDKAMRLYLESEKSRVAKREKMLNELFELKFSEWYEKQSEEFLISLLPDTFGSKKSSDRDSVAVKRFAREYFEKNEWIVVKNRFV